MGADEKASTKVETYQGLMAARIEEQLDHGWRIVSLPTGQLLLVPPPSREPSGPKL
jgi:hypothetical protein